MNILLIQLKRIGDLILTTPAIFALRAKFPDARITLVASASGVELLPAISGLDETLITGSLRSWVEIWRTNYDYCIDFTRSDRSALLTWLSRADGRIAVQRLKQKSRIRSHAYTHFVAAPLRQSHTVDHNLKLVEPLGIKDAPTSVRLDIPESAAQKAERLRSERGIKKPYLIVHPGSARSEKFWQADRWRDVIDHAQKMHGLDVVLTGGESPLERDHVAQIKSSFAQRVVDLAGATNLLTLAALIQQARILLTVDSAPMHLAAATATPQVVLFGPTNPFHWRPREVEALILRGPNPEPLRDFSPDQPSAAMNEISTDAVIDAMDALLSRPAAQGS